MHWANWRGSNCELLISPDGVFDMIRPYSRYPPSLHALKDKRGKSNVTWFLRGQTSDKIFQCTKTEVEFVNCRHRTNKNFLIWKMIIAKRLWVEIFIFCVFGCSSEHKCPSESNNDVQLVETRTVHFARLLNRSLARVEIINKLECDYSYWQLLSLVCPLKYHVTLFLTHQSLRACTDSGYRE